MGTSEGAGVDEVLHAGMRRAERRSTRAPSTLRTDGMRPIDVTVVDGTRRYWLHVAIDRFTGKVIEQNLETVNE